MATKYVTKDLLLMLNESAIRDKKNKTLTDEFFQTLPGGGIRYPIMFTMSHNDIDVRLVIGVIVDHRVEMVSIDVEYEEFNGIPEIRI